MLVDPVGDLTGVEAHVSPDLHVGDPALEDEAADVALTDAELAREGGDVEQLRNAADDTPIGSVRRGSDPGIE